MARLPQARSPRNLLEGSVDLVVSKVTGTQIGVVNSYAFSYVI